MPTIPSIRTSIENKDILVLDGHVKNGTFRRNAQGRLISYAGGFSVVYPYESADGEKWAFRCWHADVNNSQHRYEIISETIRKAHLDFLCEFIYVEKGINVEGTVYPTTRMRWVDGITIKDYICRNRDSRGLLQALADNFLKMTRALHAQSLAHGDLQHGNILVDGNHQLYLVDYDSFYCPELQGESDTVTGLPDYQHPARSRNKSVSEKLDYFSELIIYLSILAIAEAPSLIDKYLVKDADRLLFTKEDFADIRKSPVYADISALGQKYQELLDVLEEYLKCSSIDDLLPFDYFLLERKITFTTSATKAIRNMQMVRLEWDVPFEAEVYMKSPGEKDARQCEKKGELLTTLSGHSLFELLAKTNDGREIKKEVSIDVFDECEIEFTSDKEYTFQTVPVRLEWNVKHAKKVWLNKEEVDAFGTKTIEPKKDITCTLSAEDEFGIKEKRIDIRMLPLPQIKSLFVPTPNITSNLSVCINQPRYAVDVKFPTIKIDWLEVEMPKIDSLADSGLKVELALPKTTRVSMIKRVYWVIKNRINKKLLEYEREE